MCTLANDMAEVKNMLERATMGGKKINSLLFQVSWIRDDGGMKQDCGNWYGKKN